MAGTRGSQERPRATPDDYIFGKLIGEGSFSTVFLAKDVKSDREYAIKVCDKRQILREKKTEYIHREKEILKMLTQNWNPKIPFFVRLHATFQDETSLYFSLTYAKNGDLFMLIKKLGDKGIDCNCIQFYAGELVLAVEYLHSQGIIHRDLKPENILLNERMHVLITDFGSAKIVKRRKRRRTGDNREEPLESGEDYFTTSSEDEDMEGASPPKPKRRSFVGTPEYVSPEIFTSRGSSRASDLWAIGCILYQMITGIPPFQSQSEYIIFKKIEKLEYSFHEGFDENAKDLIRKLLVIEPKERLGAREKHTYASIRGHPFFKGLDFENLYKSTPVAVAQFIQQSAPGDAPDPIWARHPDWKPGIARLPQLMADCGNTSSDDELINPFEKTGNSDNESPQHHLSVAASGNQPKRSRSSRKSVIQVLTEEERAEKIKLQALSNKYHSFVEGHLILKQGILDKKKGLFAKRRMFLLTEGPHLYYVDPSAMVLKGEIPWSPEVRIEIRDFRIFFVHVPGRCYYLIDPESTSKDWCAALEEIMQFYYGKDSGDKAESSVTSTTKSS